MSAPSSPRTALRGCHSQRAFFYLQWLLITAIATTGFLNIAVGFGVGDEISDVRLAASNTISNTNTKPTTTNNLWEAGKASETEYTDAEIEALVAGPVPPPPLPIYYINLDRSKDRRELMEAMFRKLQLANTTRISAYDVNRVRKSMEEGLIRIENDVVLVEPGNEVAWARRSQNRYDYKEGACTLSHLEAIRQSYSNGDPYMLILEDDALVSPKFVRYWKDYVGLAPDNWNVLQFAVDFDSVYEQGKHLTNDPWISWKPQHWSTRANMFSRKGMERILQLTHSLDPQGRTVWTLKGEPTLVADELLYYYGKETYLSTKPWISRFEVETTLQAATADDPHIAGQVVTKEIPPLALPKRNESLLVVTQYRIQSLEEAKEELEWLRLDIQAICPMHPICDWHVQLVVTKGSLAKELAGSDLLAQLPPEVTLYIMPATNEVNKFSFVAGLISEFGKYSLLLLKDWDSRSTGFPWDTFVEKKGDAVLASALRQDPEEFMYKGFGTESRIKHPLFNGHEWPASWNTPWSADLFETVTPLRIPFLGSYFTLMDGNFAEWYFPQVLIWDFVHQSNPEGPDLMWCQAAKDFSPGRPACHLVPLSVRYEREKAIPLEKYAEGYTKTIDTWSLGRLYFSMKTRKGNQWLKEGMFWYDGLLGRDLILWELICKSWPWAIYGDPFDFQACIDRAHFVRRYRLAVGGIRSLVRIFLVALFVKWIRRGYKLAIEELLETLCQKGWLSKDTAQRILERWGGTLTSADRLLWRYCRHFPWMRMSPPTGIAAAKSGSAV